METAWERRKTQIQLPAEPHKTQANHLEDDGLEQITIERVCQVKKVSAASHSFEIVDRGGSFQIQT